MTWFGFVPRHKLTIERIYRLPNWCCINNSRTNFHFKSSSCINKKKGNLLSQGNLLGNDTTDHFFSNTETMPTFFCFCFTFHVILVDVGFYLSPFFWGGALFLDHCEAFRWFSYVRHILICLTLLLMFNFPVSTRKGVPGVGVVVKETDYFSQSLSNTLSFFLREEHISHHLSHKCISSSPRSCWLRKKRSA